MSKTVIYRLMALTLLTAPVAYATDNTPFSQMPGAASKPPGGTIEGEVKAVQPNAVIIERDKDGAEIRLPLNESTHKGPVKEGDKIEAFVTPGGTTTSVQPREGGLNR